MQLVNEFVVPRGIEETWAVLTDVERIAPAMPGAQLTGVEDGKYTGKVKIKVGPVTAAYAGVASFREQDAATHHMVLDATGKESSGRGRAAAVVTADLTAEGTETRVKVTTDLTISGPLAQFGRGAIAEVSTRLLNQFVANLKASVLADSPPASESAIAEPAVSGPVVSESAASESAVSQPVVADLTAADVTGADVTGADLTRTGRADAAGVSGTVASSESAAPATSAASVFAATVSADPAPNETDPGASATGPAASATDPAPASLASPAHAAAAPAAEVNLLRVAAWPILKRVIPLLVVIAVIVILIVWLA